MPTATWVKADMDPGDPMLFRPVPSTKKRELTVNLQSLVMASANGTDLKLCDQSNILMYWCLRELTSTNPSALSQAVNKVHNRIKMLDVGEVRDFGQHDRERAANEARLLGWPKSRPLNDVHFRMNALMRIVSDLRVHTVYMEPGTLITLHNRNRLSEFFRITGRNGLRRLC